MESGQISRIWYYRWAARKGRRTNKWTNKSTRQYRQHEQTHSRTHTMSERGERENVQQQQQILSLSRRIGVAASSTRCHNKNSTNTRRALALPFSALSPTLTHSLLRAHSLTCTTAPARSLARSCVECRASASKHNNKFTPTHTHTRTRRDTFCLPISPGFVRPPTVASFECLP